MFSQRRAPTIGNAAPDNRFYKWIILWIGVLLYDPFSFPLSFSREVYAVVSDLPPFVTHIMIPLMVAYFFYVLVSFITAQYQAFLDLGRGGSPSTPWGFIRVCFQKAIANVDVLEPPHVPPFLDPYRGQLFDLKKRSRERPIVKGVAPQRQFDQKTAPGNFEALLKILEAQAETDPDYLVVKTSFLEGHTQALTIRSRYPYTSALWSTDGEWNFEIAHPHRNDGSLHMVLHPEDVRTVIEKGWGEKHPLSSESGWWKLFNHYVRRIRRPTPPNLCFIYAPKTDAEWEAVKDILKAAVWWNKDRYQKYVLAQGDALPDEKVTL